MIILYNTNEYLGGGETLALKLCEKLANYDDIAMITSEGSFISQNIKLGCRILELPSYSYYYMNLKEREQYLKDITSFVKVFGDLKIITFCFKDLYPVVDLSKTIKFTPFHLVLHPLDHLYVAQSLLDKARLRLLKTAKYSKAGIVSANKYILHELNEKDSLVSMNTNTTNRIYQDYSIRVKHTIALPVFNEYPIVKNKNVTTKKIVWVGRLVDFKLPAVFAMIDFLNTCSSYTLSIIGAGDSIKVLNYIKGKKNPLLTKQVRLLGEVPHNNLQEQLKNFNIGYAMGTSIVEICSLGIPTIVATASPHFEKFTGALCSGMCYELDYGNVGDELYDLSIDCAKLKRIPECISRIEKNYDLEAQKSYDFVKGMFSSERNLIKYKNIFLNNSSETNTFGGLTIPRYDPLKKVLFEFASCVKKVRTQTCAKFHCA